MNTKFDLTIDLDKIISRKHGKFDLGKKLDKAIKDGVVDLSKQVTDKLYLNMILYGLGDSKIPTKVDVYPLVDGIAININSEYYMFVEYGTGIVGQNNPHPKPSSDWIYDSENHGESGWWYPSTSSDPNPTKYTAKDGNIWAWTKGQASRPFMYDTWLWAKQSANNIIQKHINRALKEEERKWK